MLMSGFEPWISGIGSDRSNNSATTTAHSWRMFLQKNNSCKVTKTLSAYFTS